MARLEIPIAHQILSSTGDVKLWADIGLLLKDQAGNFVPETFRVDTGTQITTTLVRAMGTGQVRFRDLPAVVAKEMTTGTLIAVAMAAAAMIRAFTLGVGLQIALTVTLTVAAIVVWSALVSSILPLVLKQIRIDPAVVSAPMIATIVDGTGLMIYFVVAHATLPQLAGL